MSKPQVGIQLYSVRDRSEKDFLGTIREIAEIGYKNVELAGTYGVSAADLKKALADAGLNVNSAHVGLNVQDPDKFESDLNEKVAYYKELGVKRFVVPHYPLADNPSVDDVNKFADTLKRASAIVRAAGLEFGYHNHAFEFKPAQDGKLVIDHLMEQLSPEELIAEFDLGWVKVAGQDPAAFIEKYADRLPLVHAKDFKEDGSDAGIGHGMVDWDSALAAAEKAGVEYVIIEQEQYEVSSIESAKQNFAFFKDRGWV
ncbi:sugar phosphate isomerase/epimerase family protein [Cohnella rhizosphaerae]|uniref:Sugar phosphate isomerase/epimerase n=1 Tax=Cohnella rhizosphaerae TaxID=1457232 RepID=A0A9X4QSC0_9BACL|nr:sugar phosphate isomerase/epimerase [Cohnella rhizosphaerae]MDG0809440.1 sugar phosphate isomerase/epimerase [Cohnella rhizosphaerae]